MISNRIRSISSSNEVFNRAATFYNSALKSSGFKENITAFANDSIKVAKSRARNIIWFNPPFSINVKTNVAKLFLNLIDKNFPKSHKFHKLFNRNNLKVSYSCLPNIRNIITSHNNKILSNSSNLNAPTCNCRQINLCPLNGKCLTKNVIYLCNVKTNPQDEGRYYIGLTEKTFKDRLYKHNNSFRYESGSNSTELSKFVWSVKKKGLNPVLSWKILDQAEPFKPGGKSCNLCLMEKYHIISSPLPLLNKRNELASKCRHENKYMMNNFNVIKEDTPLYF